MNRLKHACVLVVVVVLAVCGASCKSDLPAPEWRDGEVTAASENVLWEVTVLALEKEGYPVGAGLDPSTGVALSGWKSSLAPFKGKGWRARAHVKYERTAPGRYRVDVRVEKELNQDLARPLDPSYAQWEPTADDAERAQVLLQRIRSYLGGEIEVADPRKKRFGS
ncbi:MAG: hypothetical protein L6Q99_19970 [Planctomycetes bacterium]|nr:hypothetical protein [Planctomycetota bacterium]